MERRARPVKPLNEPVQVSVRHDLHGLPVAVKLVEVLPATKHEVVRQRRRAGVATARSKWLNVTGIEDMYEVDELWWRGSDQEIQRIYFDLRLENTRKVTVYRDLIADLWYRQAD